MAAPHRCDFQRGKYWHTYKGLDQKLLDVSKFILIDPENNKTYSEALADLLTSIGNSVDTFFRNMCLCPPLNANLWKPSDRLTITDYRRICEPYYGLSKNSVIVPFGLGNTQRITPFEAFQRRASPDWWSSYNHVKHDYLKYIKEANLFNALNALGGLLILNALHNCSQSYLINSGIIRDQRGVITLDEAGNIFVTPEGVTGYSEEGEAVYIETNNFYYKFRNIDMS